MLTDIAGSTRLWEAQPEGMPAAITMHYSLLSDAVGRHGGVLPVEQGEGDSVVAAFSRGSDAVAAALDAQRALCMQAWPDGVELRVRIALHTGEPELRDEGNYFGVALSRCARLRAIAHGGQTVMSRATRDLVVDRMPDGAELLDCGAHRLRDLGRPEHVYALAHPDLPVVTKPLRSLDAFVNNLPDQLTSFVGRDSELAEIRAAFEETRLLTLTGPGGAGKTRLALQAAADLLDRFPDGVWWVELASLIDEEQVGEQLASAIGVRPLPGMSTLEASCMHLAERRALVVLDNCEHLLSVSAAAVEALLHTCPQVSVLATSRTPLGVGGESEWRVPSLALPAAEPAREPLAVLTQCDAVRLFIDRARKARPNFAVNNDNAPAVAEICHSLDGLPLAIELAAARVRMLSVEQILSGLGDRFHLLTRGARTALPRHQTLRASVDWSHELLTDEERALFRRLSVFAGGFTLDAVEEVGAGDGLERIAVLDLLSSLVDKSLVAAEERGPAVRYRLLETIRQYASERLTEAGEVESIRDRHRDAYLALAERAAPELAKRREWLDVLDAESANVEAALERAVQTNGEIALRLCVALFHWWRMRGWSTAARDCERALEAADGTPSRLRARALCVHGYLLLAGGKYDVAIATAQEALQMAEDLGDEFAQGRALGTLSFVQLFPDPVGSRAGLKRASELAAASGDDWCWLDTTGNRSWSHQVICDEHDQGERVRSDMLQYAEQQGYPDFVSWYWLMESWRPLVRGEAERFRELVDRALAAAREVREPITEATGENWIAWHELEQGLTEASFARIEGVREGLVPAGAGLALPYMDVRLATNRASVGDLDGARALLEPLVSSGVDFGWGLGWALVTLAEVLRLTGDEAGARRRAAEALELAERISSRHLIAMSKEELAFVAAAAGEWSEAEALLHSALALRAEHELFLTLPRTVDWLAAVAAEFESREEATRLLGVAQRTRADRGLVRWPPDQPRFAQLERTLRSTLGDEAFDRAVEEGAKLTLDDALSWLRRARGERKRPARGWESLTPTELKVIEFVSEGLTNPQIGERMFISRGTVKVHLSHIFGKLGISTRTELAAEATRRVASGPKAG
jgi:predicted ATPase/class 3 adenylate cyclase/DNA-binding CsgD family transcriptional regulator